MTKTEEFRTWVAAFDQGQQDKLVKFGTWSIAGSVVVAKTLDWAFPKQEGDTSAGKELVAGYLLNPQHPIKINNPEDAANCIVNLLLEPSTIFFSPFSFPVDIRTGAD